MGFRRSSSWAWVFGILCLGGCKVGPDYARIPANVPAAFKEPPPAGWKLAQPSDAIDRGAWWSIFHDPVLDGLEQQVAISNQTLKQAEADYRVAQASVQSVAGALWPTLSLSPGVTRSSQAGRSSGGNRATTSTSYSLEASASWQIDLWGKIRRQVENDVAAAQASAADVANARLSAQSSLATDYFELRGSDALQALLEDTVAQYRRALSIAQNQYQAGTAARSDVITAQTQLLGTQAQLINVGVARAQYEHAIAVLTGHAPADLSIKPDKLASAVPQIPVALPATLLERRPDIAAAERAMAQENALIGVATAAFYPAVDLTAAFGYVGNPLGSLISASNQVWSLGASANQALFEGGTLSANLAAARAAYDAQVANYRQTVLTALQNVEDGLSDLRILEQQEAAENEAVKVANQAVQIALNEYQAGTQAYTTVVTAQATALADAQSALSVQVQRLVDAVALITALGGGWDSSQLPDPKSLNPTLPTGI
jgi:NodT family efflux transporter outer membrane factor (OMF) lipoprotein